MIRHLFCILILAFLLLGFDHVQNGDLQRKADVTQVVSSVAKEYVQIDNTCSVTSVQPKNEYGRFADSDIISGFQFDNGIVSPGFSLKEITPTSTLKLRANSAIQVLKSLVTQLPCEKYRFLSISNKYARYSCEYYVYTLGHILI